MAWPPDHPFNFLSEIARGRNYKAMNMSTEELPGRYLAGMPQLSYTGLSENWLLKECGHRHWLKLAETHGMSVPVFVDDTGQKTYAAFTAVRLSTARLDHVEENHVFSLDSTLGRAGRAQYCSRHEIHSNGQLLGLVEMLSAFVVRNEAGNNRSVTRASFASTQEESAPLQEAAAELVLLAKQFRTGDYRERLGLAPPQHCAVHEITFLPCPNNDFNGADFLYFASFQAFVDRAEWEWFRFQAPPLVSDRELFFYGNVNVGEKLCIRLRAEKSDETGIVHWCEILRGEDGKKIADVITHKRWRS